jgi:2-oxoglutarate ferredoxin oxidoreductase subunit alpha
MMQARWGSHGDYQIIAISPFSPQECFDFAIKAFNLSEKYRVPVMLMMDECVGHMTGKVVIPGAGDINLYSRRHTTEPPEKYLPYKPDADLVPSIVKAGEGYNIHITGLTHDEKGYPAMNVAEQDKLIKRLTDKIKNNADDIIEYREEQVEDAEVVIISYGITSRVAVPAIEEARAKGIKVGHLRLVVVWPFPEKRIKELAKQVKAFVVPEINLGQIVLEVERCAAGAADVHSVPHAGGGVHDPAVILEKILLSVNKK